MKDKIFVCLYACCISVTSSFKEIPYFNRQLHWRFRVFKPHFTEFIHEELSKDQVVIQIWISSIETSLKKRRQEQLRNLKTK